MGGAQGRARQWLRSFRAYTLYWSERDNARESRRLDVACYLSCPPPPLPALPGAPSLLPPGRSGPRLLETLQFIPVT
ncbi:unnamed protein product [Danaus chrysippus]|uniref:(African queen) hypothetical protein n=1 Tax=Danaus chrysippus TaxID=151541 RepID=A0A8J2R5R5_9NEOP|nr:unnamed protein product [Danaus chrysippus]